MQNYDPDELVTIARFTNQLELDIARGFLESEGITSWAPEEHVVASSGGLYGIAVGGMRLQVRASEAEGAARLIQDIDESSSPSLHDEQDH
jgi:NADPH-dependent 7-cyano-7-deazaguanine reductase QueF-like protein